MFCLELRKADGLESNTEHDVLLQGINPSLCVRLAKTRVRITHRTLTHTGKNDNASQGLGVGCSDMSF
jgi:hypothetical protein